MRLVLSRYACLRRRGGELIVEGRRGDPATVVDDERVVRLLQMMASPSLLPDAAAQAGINAEEAVALVEPLVARGILVDEATAAGEDRSVWDFDDVRIHQRTRHRDLGPFPRPGAPEPPPALAPARWPVTVLLPRPDLDARERDDLPLAAVQTARRSIRTPGPHPIPLAGLGEFLFRVGRVEDLWHQGGLAFAARPYPAAGALYELELFVAAHDCQGVEPRLYYYAPDHHGLAPVDGTPAATVELLADAAAGMGITETPQALVVIAARFPRIAWKYGPLAYSLMLKNVGVVLQTMYLVATSMGLGACAVGTGEASAFERATGLDPERETSIGELALATVGSGQ